MIVKDPPAYVLHARIVAGRAMARPFLPSFDVWAKEQRIASLKRLLKREQTT